MTTKLKLILQNFEIKISKIESISFSQSKLVIVILKFLFDFDLLNSEFYEMEENEQTYFKQFILERYFQHNISKKENYLDMYHGIKIEEEPNYLNQNQELVSSELASNNFSKIDSHYSNNIAESNSIFKITIYEPKHNILDYVENKYLDKDTLNKNNKTVTLTIPKCTKTYIKSKQFQISTLQNYLRNLERLSLLCKTRKKTQLKSKLKRNDEKIKKVFKFVMKSMFIRFKKHKIEPK